MDPPGCLPSLRWAAARGPGAELSGLVSPHRCLRAAVEAALFNGPVWRRGKLIYSHFWKSWTLMHLVCLHLKGSVRRAGHGVRFFLRREVRLRLRLQASCRSASVSSSLQMNSRNACLLWRGPLTSSQFPAAILAPPMCSMHLHRSTQLQGSCLV